MQITLEKIVWIALVLVVVAVVGLYLMGVTTTQSREIGQKAYVRLVSSQFIDGQDQYVITVRIVNSGENGKSLYLSNAEISATGFNPGTVASTTPDVSSGVEIGPKESLDLTITINSQYVAGTKSITLSPYVYDAGSDYTTASSDGTQIAISVPVP